MTLNLEQYLHENMSSVVDADRLLKIVIDNNLDTAVLNMFDTIYNAIDMVNDDMDSLKADIRYQAASLMELAGE